MILASIIIPTIARPSLERSVQSVLAQQLAVPLPGFEVIVVNDSGHPLPAADWKADPRVRVLDTQRRERIFARNSGAAAARGGYLHFLDDDDWLLPGALQGLGDLAERSPAHWLYGGSQLVDRRGRPLLQLHHDLSGNCFAQIMAGEWVPLQSSWIETGAFFAAGGFSAGVMATQDVDLCRRIALGGDLQGTRTLVACIGMGEEGSSTDYRRASEYSRQARERILDQRGAFSRLRSSAHSPAWQGRVARVYLTSVVWNLAHRRGFTALSRGLHGLAAVALAGPGLLSGAFWRAASSSYQSETFARGMAESQPPSGSQQPLSYQ